MKKQLQHINISKSKSQAGIFLILLLGEQESEHMIPSSTVCMVIGISCKFKFFNDDATISHFKAVMAINIV